MSWTFGKFTVYEKWQAAQDLIELGIPTPATFARANSVLMTLGPQYGRGWLLMLRRDLDRLDKEALHSLTVTDPNGKGSMTVDGWLMLFSRRLFPGKDNDPDSLHLLEIADGRWRAGGNPGLYAHAVNKQFNIHGPDCGLPDTDEDYYDDTLNASTRWTWAGMVNYLWTQLAKQLGPYPGLPTSPHHYPEGWSFAGVSCYAALTEVLDRLCYALAPNADGGFRIVRIGDPDQATAKILQHAESDNRKLDDTESREGIRGRMPEGADIYFHVRYKNYGEEETTTRATGVGGQWQGKPAHVVSVDNPYGGGEENVRQPIWDDMPAVYSSLTANITAASSTLVTARAAERAADYFRALKNCPRSHKIFSGIVDVLPGSTIKGVAWRQVIAPDAEGGTVTEIVQHPARRLRISEDARFTPERDSGSSTSVRAPDFRPTWPVYPPVEQVLFLHKHPGDDIVKPDTRGRYNCKVGQFDSSSLTWIEREKCWGVLVVNDNGSALFDGDRVPARLLGFNCKDQDCRPVYGFWACNCPATASGSGSGNPCCPAGALPGSLVADLSAPGLTCLDGTSIAMFPMPGGGYSGTSSVECSPCCQAAELTLICDRKTGTYLLNGSVHMTTNSCDPFSLSGLTNSMELFPNQCCMDSFIGGSIPIDIDIHLP